MSQVQITLIGTFPQGQELRTGASLIELLLHLGHVLTLESLVELLEPKCQVPGHSAVSIDPKGDFLALSKSDHFFRMSKPNLEAIFPLLAKMTFLDDFKVMSKELLLLGSALEGLKDSVCDLHFLILKLRVSE